MYNVTLLTAEQLRKEYQKLSKKQLIEMLIENNKLLDLINKKALLI